MQHIGRFFRMEKLSDIFPETLNYWFEKIGEAIRDKTRMGIGGHGLDNIQTTINRLIEALNKRGISRGALQPLDNILEEVEYTTSQLEGYLGHKSQDSDIANTKVASIFLWYLSHNFDTLRSMAREIDEEYAI